MRRDHRYKIQISNSARFALLYSQQVKKNKTTALGFWAHFPCIKIQIPCQEGARAGDQETNLQLVFLWSGPGTMDEPPTTSGGLFSLEAGQRPVDDLTSMPQYNTLHIRIKSQVKITPQDKCVFPDAELENTPRNLKPYTSWNPTDQEPLSPFSPGHYNAG